MQYTLEVVKILKRKNSSEAFVKDYFVEDPVSGERCEKDLNGKLVDLLKTGPAREGGYCDLEAIAEHLIANDVEISAQRKD